MSFWKQNEKNLLQRWELHRRQIEREVAERRRDLVRRNMRRSSEWTNYEPYTDWYLEREIAAFVEALDEISGANHLDIDDESLDEMDRMLVEMVDRRRQLAPAEVMGDLDSQHARLKGSARVGLLKIQTRRRTERERSASPAPPPPIQRRGREASSNPAPAASSSPAAVSHRPTAFAPATAAPADSVDTHTLADSLRRLAQLIQRLPDPEEQAETLEELQFVAEEATAVPDRRKLRMVASALERIRERIAAADEESGSAAAAHADPIRRWFELSA